MKTGVSLKNRQGGAVAVMVGISIVLLVGFLAMVIDLGHLYIAKSELQNAADAAALAGVKELNGKAYGVANAVAKAVEIAERNRYDFSKPVAITIANIRVGNCPDPGCMVSASGISDAVAANKYFIEVDTGSRSLDTWFAPIWNIMTTSTFGMAVAGRYLIDVIPLAMCALDISKCAVHPDVPEATCTEESCECGYQRGKAYDVAQVNYGAGGINPGTIYWLDPLATIPDCTVTSTNDGRPFICQGKSAINAGIGAFVYTNTGVATPLLAALDSRFNHYDPQGKCDPETAPPDVNVREYLWNNLNDPAISWMSAVPATQTAQVTSDKNIRPVHTDNDGVVWSFVRPESNPIPLTPASGIYPEYPGRSENLANYPISGVPYTDSTSTNFWEAPTGGGAAFAKPERRALNLVIVNCPSNAGGNCRETRVVGVGRFLMQRNANQTNPKGIFVEFDRFVPGESKASEYKLYR